MRKIKLTKQQQLIRNEFKNVDRELLSRELQTSMGYIHQLIGGFVPIGAKRAKQIEKITRGRVRAAVLRPDIFGDN